MAEETAITVLHGKPDAAELAAVTSVLLARLRLRTHPEETPTSESVSRAGWTVRGESQPATTSWTTRGRR